MTDSTSRSIPLATAPNLRTLGGLPVEGGTVKDGLLFRSATLAALSDADGQVLLGLGIRRVFDLRTAAESADAPDRLPAGITGVPLDVLGDHAQDLAASLGHIGLPGGEDAPAPSEAEREAIVSQMTEMLGRGRGIALMQESYRNIVSSDSALAAYRSFYEALTEQPEYAPSLFHCTTGKDRTGWAAASFLLLLGASTETVLADYLQTNTDILPMIEPMLARAEAAGFDPDILRPVLTVQQSVLEAALQEVADRFGSIQAYFTEGLGLSIDHLAALRERFVNTTAGA